VPILTAQRFPGLDPRGPGSIPASGPENGPVGRQRPTDEFVDSKGIAAFVHGIVWDEEVHRNGQ
jgi:hypothetical protein